MLRLLVVSALSLSISACAPRIVRAPLAPAVTSQLNVSFSRIWVAGFLTSRSEELDINVETVRLIRMQLRAQPSVVMVDAQPLAIDAEQQFSDTAYWRRLGEEHGAPLIVTGSVRLLLAPPGIEQHGPRTTYIPTAGRILEATVILIDGRSGTTLLSQRLPSRMRYGVGRWSSGLSLYFQLMDRSMPDWFRAIAGTRKIDSNLSLGGQR
jgi:hypothetical protein